MSVKPAELSNKLRFGVFEVDLVQRELRRRGLRVHLQEKPFKILEILLAARGRLVTRKELAASLWPSLNVSFDQSLNTAMNALRQALGDSSKSVRFIETRPGLGYRFIGTVEEMASEPHANGIAVAQSELMRDYRTGRHFHERFNEVAVHQSIAYFESATSHDPHFAPAFAGLADAHASLALLNTEPPDGAREFSHAFISRAFELGPHLAEVEAARARYLRVFQGDLDAASESLARALRLNANCSDAHRELALNLAAQSRFDEAIEAAEAALRIDPVSLANNCALAWVLYMARNYREAYDQCWRTLAIDATLPFAQYILGLACQQLGMIEDAMAELKNARYYWGDNPAAVSALANVYAVSGARADAEELTSQLERSAQTRYVSPSWLAVAYAGLGDLERAEKAMERAASKGDVWRIWMRNDARMK